MCGGGGGGGNGNKRNKNVVSVTERSFQSPGTTGGPIRSGESFRVSRSPGEMKAATGFAQLVGAISGIPGAGSLLAKGVGRRTTREVDAAGRQIGGANIDVGDKGTALASAVIPPGGQRPSEALKAQSITEAKRKKARVTGRKSTVLAGRKIAEEQLKTKLGQ